MKRLTDTQKETNKTEAWNKLISIIMERIENERRTNAAEQKCNWVLHLWSGDADLQTEEKRKSVEADKQYNQLDDQQSG